MCTICGSVSPSCHVSHTDETPVSNCHFTYLAHNLALFSLSTAWQMGALGYLMFMLLTKSDYYKISTLRNMGSMFGSGDVRAGKVCVD